MPDRLLAEHDRARIVERDRRQSLRRSLVADPLERLLPLELLVPLDGEPEARRDRVVLGADVLAPEAVALLQTERIERTEARGDETVRAAGLPQQVPDAGAHLERPVQLPAELADVADPLCEHRHLADLDLAARHVGDRVVRDVVGGRGAEHVTRLGPEQPQHERAARAVEDPHPFAVAHLRAEPREVVHARPAAGNDHEDVLVVAGHREVAADPAAGREHRRVDDGADRAVDPVRAHALEEGRCVGALHPELHVRGQVEQSGRARAPRGARLPRSGTTRVPPTPSGAPTRGSRHRPARGWLRTTAGVPTRRR